jgi:hypothetical protein
MEETPLDAAVEEPTGPARPRAQSLRDIVDNPWLLLATLFFVTLFLGLPLLWISRGFSPVWKVVLTIAVLAWTALVLWVFWLIMVWSYTRVADALGWS